MVPDAELCQYVKGQGEPFPAQSPFTSIKFALAWALNEPGLTPVKAPTVDPLGLAT